MSICVKNILTNFAYYNRINIYEYFWITVIRNNIPMSFTKFIKDGFYMKINKIIAAAAAAVMAMSAAAFSVFADDNATFCFDTDSSLSMLQTYGAVEETGFKASIDNQVKVGGNGSLKLSEEVGAAVSDDNQSGGIYIDSSAFGLDSFADCTVSMKVMFDKEAAKLAPSFTIFTDGIVWMSCEVNSEQAGNWTDVVISVPGNADNTRVGFLIPVFETYSGAVAYVDDITITKADGTTIANVGDQKESENIVVSITKGPRIILLIVVCLILVGVVAGAGFVISKFQNKFTQ